MPTVTAPGTPLLHSVGNEFRAIVHTEMSGRWLELEQLLDRDDQQPASPVPGDQTVAAALIEH